MGVHGLWELVSESDKKAGGSLVSLAWCSGQAWAVDLTPWIVHSRTAAYSTGVGQTYIVIKTVFYRTLCLLKHGIIPIFILDGHRAPVVKESKMQYRSQTIYGYTKETPADRSGLSFTNESCRNLLESLGLTVIVSPGEAEKTCAFLNQKGVVDACLTEDGDVFLYGATTVYRRTDFSEMTVQRHCMADIDEALQLNRRDLVLLGLLSGCDYGGGVASIGPKKVCDLIKDIKRHEQDALARVLKWRENSQLQKLAEKEEQLSETKKDTHCTSCFHPGRKSDHNTAGCRVCKTSNGCGKGPSPIPCGCAYCVIEQEISPYRRELDIRKKALVTEGFPNLELVSEFLDDDTIIGYPARATLKMPDWTALAQNMRQFLNMDEEKLMEKMVPVLVHMHLHGTLDIPNAKPLPILKTCKRHFIHCYQVPFERFAFDQWSPGVLSSGDKTPDSTDAAPQAAYTVDITCELLEEKCPDLVEQFRQSGPKKKGRKGKRTACDPAQQTPTDKFATAVKRCLFDDGEKE